MAVAAAPHVLTVAVNDDDGRAGALHAVVWDGLEDARLRARGAALPPAPDRRARASRLGGADRDRPLPPSPQLDLDVRGVTLMRSFLGGGPARYEALAHGTLGA